MPDELHSIFDKPWLAPQGALCELHQYVFLLQIILNDGLIVGETRQLQHDRFDGLGSKVREALISN